MSLHNFDDLHESLHEREALRKTIENGGIEKVSARGRGILPGDDDPGWDSINLNRGMQVMAVENGQFIINVRGQGNLRASNHAIRQLGSLMGVKMGKFFGGMPPEQINKAISFHLKAQPKPLYRRIISRGHGESNIIAELDGVRIPKQKKLFGDDIATDGVLRGFVSPTYSEIKDVRVFDRIKEVADPAELDDQGIAIYSFRDNGSHFMLVDKEPVDLLTAGKVGQLSSGMGMGSGNIGDAAYFGIRIRNSEVGAYALSAHPYFVRFVCTNGVIVGVKEEPLLYRQHRGISDAELDRLVGRMYQSLPDRTKSIIDNTKKLHNEAIEDAELEINDFLRREPKTLKLAVIKAYNEEPIPTAYGVMQAIARTAMAWRRDMDKQLDIEQLAGRYMQHVIKRIG